MEIWTGIIIPIVCAIIGGLVGGLFTYLGVRITIQNDRKTAEETRRLQNMEFNQAIVNKRPILELQKNSDNYTFQNGLYLVPYSKCYLLNNFEIRFKNKENIEWECVSIYLKNIGKKKIVKAFVQLSDTLLNVNLYNKYEKQLSNFKEDGKFSDAQPIFGEININDVVVLDIFYPSDQPNLKFTSFTIYFEDENANKWKQYFVGCEDVDYRLYEAVSDLEFSTILDKRMNAFYMYHRAYFDDNAEKRFKYDVREMSQALNVQLNKWNDISFKFSQFKYQYESGEIALKREFSQF